MLIVVADQTPAERLDVYLLGALEGLSRSRIQALIRDGMVRVGGALRRPSYAVQPGDRIEVELPAPQPLRLVPEDVPLDVRYEDDALLVVNKPAGMTVHPAPGAWTGTLVHALLHHCRDLSGINGVLRPGIVHRLDKDTSGLLLVAKGDAAHRGLAAQLQGHRLQRTYLALVWGIVDGEGTVEAPIARHPQDRKRMAVVAGGREALTQYRVRERLAPCTLLDVELSTGRTHQIRVHMQHIGHPVFGDPVYGGRNQLGGVRPELRARAATMLAAMPRQALHARRLRFRHPLDGRPLEVEAPMPQDLVRLLALARGEVDGAGGAIKASAGTPAG